MLGSVMKRNQSQADLLPWIWILFRSVVSSLLSCERTCPHCAHIIKKCSQVCFQLYICCDSHFGFKTSICHTISSASCYMVAERFGFGPIVDNGKQAALGAAHRLVMERQGILWNALMQEGRARAEVGRRLSWALGEVCSRADAAMVTMTDGVGPNLMSGSFSPMMGCIETRLLENPDKSEGQAHWIGSTSRRRVVT